MRSSRLARGACFWPGPAAISIECLNITPYIRGEACTQTRGGA